MNHRPAHRVEADIAHDSEAAIAHGARTGALAASGIVAGPAALVAAAPSALRLSAGPLGLVAGWALVAGLLVLPLLVVSAAARGARRALAEGASAATVRVVFGAAFALALAVPVHALVAATLKVHTHHRALGGTTFAVLALGVYLVLWAIGYRLAAVASDRAVLGAYAVSDGALREAASAAVAVALTLGTIAAVVLPVGTASPLRERALLLDVALALAGVAGGSVVAAPGRRWAWLAAVSVAAVAIGMGALVAVATKPGFALAVEAQAPLAAAWVRCARTWE